MAASRLWRTLSAFNHSTRRWGPVLSRNAQCQVSQGPSLSPSPLSPSSPSSRRVDTISTLMRSPTPCNVNAVSAPRLSLVSWNINAFSPRPVARAKFILNHILEAPEYPNVIFLQEVIPSVRDFLLNDAKVRDAFLITDAEDQRAFEDVPFSTMTLLSSRCFASSIDLQDKTGDRVDEKVMLGHVSRIALPSKYRRDALSMDIIPLSIPDTVLRLINVHLDSLGDTLYYRTQQIETLANVLREPGCKGGIIAGDFNAISAEDHALIDENELTDGWVMLHGIANGYTWGVGMEHRDGLGAGRLDKIAMLGTKAEKMEVLRPGSIEVPRPSEESLEIPWSDHCGLRCTFTI